MGGGDANGPIARSHDAWTGRPSTIWISLLRCTGLGGKLGIDATKKIGSETSRGWGETMHMRQEIERHVASRWRELFPEPQPGSQS